MQQSFPDIAVNFDPLEFLVEISRHRANVETLAAVADVMEYCASAAENPWPEDIQLDDLLLHYLDPSWGGAPYKRLVGETIAGFYALGREGGYVELPRIYAAYLPADAQVAKDGVLLFDARFDQMPEVCALASRFDGVFDGDRQYRSEIHRLVTCNSNLALQGIHDHLAGRWHGASPPVTSLSPVMASRERVLACSAFWACDGAGHSVH